MGENENIVYVMHEMLQKTWSNGTRHQSSQRHDYLEKQCAIQRVLFERPAKVYKVSFISFRLKDAAELLMIHDNIKGCAASFHLKAMRFVCLFVFSAAHTQINEPKFHVNFIIMKTNPRARSNRYQCVIRPKVHFATELSFKTNYKLRVWYGWLTIASSQAWRWASSTAAFSSSLGTWDSTIIRLNWAEDRMTDCPDGSSLGILVHQNKSKKQA